MPVTTIKPAAAKSRSKTATGKSTQESTSIVTQLSAAVKPSSETRQIPAKRGRPSRKKSRRQQHGSAWHWKQTDSWYYTLPSTHKRVPLFDLEGQRIRGLDNRKEAQLALARVKLSGELAPVAEPPANSDAWVVAKVCSEYIQYCERGLAAGTLSKGHRESTVSFLNDLCRYCGALQVSQLKKGHIRTWIDSHTTWKSPSTIGNAIAVVQAAFNHCEENFDIPNPVKGLKKPRTQPRLHSFSEEDEAALYTATDECYGDFLFAAIHTGLRPFCELATITADHVEETPRGMMWRVYSSKTKKTRKIPIRQEVAELARRLINTAPAGSRIPLFRNTHGTRWTKVAGVQRFRQIRQQLGWKDDPVRVKYSTYTCRHTFAHRMLSGYWNGGQGCTVETLAELIGDTPKVAFDHYGKDWGQHYQDPLWAAIGVPAPAKPTSRVRKKKPR